MPILGRRHVSVGASLLVLTLATGVSPVAATEAPPQELRYVCVDSRGNLVQAAGPADCEPAETLRTLPDDGPVRWCADHLGRLKESTSCARRERTIQIPEDGPVFVCARNIRGGTTLPRGELRTVVDLSECNQDETGLVTPAAPEGVADSWTIDEDTLLVVPDKGVLDNDIDLTGAPLTATLVQGPARGVLELDAGGGFRYDPRGAFDALDAGESATATFTYRADDGGLSSAPTTVTLTITGRNDRPVAADDEYVTDEDTALAVSPPGVLANDTDAEGHPLTSVLVDDVARGELTLGEPGGLRFDPRADFQHLGATSGDDDEATFTYVTRDGTSSSDERTVRIRVVGINDRPVGAPDSVATDENTAILIDPANLLANDIDAEGQAMAVTAVSLEGAGVGTLTTLADGTLRYDPDADSADPDSAPDLDHLAHGEVATVRFTYAARDGGGLSSVPVTVSITVRGLSAPTANDDVRTTDEDHAVAIDLLANDQVRGGQLVLDQSGTEGQVTLEHDGVVRYDPSGAFDHLAEGATQTDSFRYTLTNGEGSSTGTASVQVTGLNDAPVGVADLYAVVPGNVLTVAPSGVLANDLDADAGTDLKAVLVSPPDRGRLTLAPEGGFSFDPAGEFSGGGSTSFTYRAYDGSAESQTVPVTLTVSSNEAPVFVGANAPFTTVVTDPPGTSLGTLTAQDADGDPLAFEILSADTDAFVLGPVVAGDPGAEVKVDLLVGPAGPPAVATYTLTIGVDDGHGGTATRTVSVRVVPELNAVDDRYVAVGNTRLVGGSPTVVPPEAGKVRVSGLLDNDGGNGATVDGRTGMPTDEGGSVDIAEDGSFVYTPPPADPNAPPEAGLWDGQSALTDRFRYQILGEGVADTEGEVSIELLDAVWYVDNAPLGSGTGTGTAWSPFRSLSEVSTGVDRDLPGQTLFLLGHAAPESAHPGGVTLEDGQALVGHGAGLSVSHGDSEIRVVAPGPVPRVDGTTGADAAPAVRLARDNELRGFTVGGDGDGIVGDDVGNLTTEITSVSTLGDPLRLAGHTTVDVAIADVRSGPATVLALTGLAGGPDVGADDGFDGVAIGAVGPRADGGPGGPGVDIRELRGVVDLGTVVMGQGAFQVHDSAVSATVSAVDVTGSGSETGLTVRRNLGEVTLGQLHLSGVVGTAIEIEDDDGTTTVGDGVVTGTASGDALLAISNDDADDADDPGGTLGTAPGSAGDILIGADLRTEAGAPCLVVSIAGIDQQLLGDGDVQRGTVEVSGHVTGRGCGILVSGSTEAVSGAVSFTGGMDVVTTGAAAFRAEEVVAPGTVEVTNSPAGTVLTSSGHAALQIADTHVGAAGARFSRVDATNAPTGIEVSGVSAASAAGVTPGLLVNAGTITTPTTTGAAIADADAVTLRGLRIDRSRADGVTVTGSTAVTLDDLTIQQPERVGLVARRSGDVLVDGTSISSAGSYGVQVVDLEGTTTLRGMTVQGSRDTQLVASDGTTPTGEQDALVVESSVFSGGEPEDDSIVVSAGLDAGAATPSDLRFQVSGETPSGSIGGDTGLDAAASAGAHLQVDLARFAVADTGSDALALTATGTGTSLDIDLATINSSGGGGIQLARGAGVRVTGDGLATVDVTMSQVQVTSTEHSGIVLDQVTSATLDTTRVNATERHGIEVTGSDGVTLDQVEVIRPARHGIRIFDSSDVVVDDSRIDMRPPPTVPSTAPADTVLPSFSAVHMRHVGGSNAVTDTTVRAATGDQVRVHNGDLATGVDPSDALQVGSVVISGITAVETAIDPVLSRTTSTAVPIPDADAVSVLAGAGANLTVDLTGNASSVDETLALTARRGGVLAVTGGHAVTHVSADAKATTTGGKDERTTSAPDPTLVLTASGPGSKLSLGLSGLRVVQQAVAAGMHSPAQALLVEADAGGAVAPVTGTSSLSSSEVTGQGAANVVELLADGRIDTNGDGTPDGASSTLSFTTDAVNVTVDAPAGSGSFWDAISVTGQDEGEVTDLRLTGGTVTAFGGEGIDLQTVGTDPPDPDPDLPTPAWPEGTIVAALVEGVTVRGGAGDAIEATGQVDELVVRSSRVTGGSASAHGVRVLEGVGCVDLQDNDTTAMSGTGFDLIGVALADFREAGHESETVEQWLARKGNTGPPDRVLSDTSFASGAC